MFTYVQSIKIEVVNRVNGKNYIRDMENKLEKTLKNAGRTKR